MEKFLIALKITTQLDCLFIIFIGVFSGIIAGALPGISSPMALSLLIPFTYSMSPTMAIILLAANYYGTTYGGSISAILFRAPGTPEASCTVFDGYPMAQKGLAGKALGTAIISSTIGGMSSCIILTLIAPKLGIVALKFGPPEYFALALLGLSAVTSAGKSSLIEQIKAISTMSIGLLTAVVGLQYTTGITRFTFGLTKLLVGFNYVPCVIGLFAMSQVFSNAGKVGADTIISEKMKKVQTELMKFRDIAKFKWIILRSAAIGWVLGTLPGTGSTISAFIAYNETVRTSKYPEKFGTGMQEGIVAPETANNAAASATFIPTLTLGIPGGSSTAVILGAFLIHGIIPGPGLFTKNPEVFVYPLFISGFIANTMMFFIGVYLSKYIAKVLYIRKSILNTIILLLCIVGSFALNNNIFDVWVMLIMGVFGYILMKLNFPLAPMILGIILGPIAEKAFVISMILSNNNPWVFFTRPISGPITILAILAFLIPFSRVFLKKVKSS